jgi:hypothetical protein
LGAVKNGLDQQFSHLDIRRIGARGGPPIAEAKRNRAYGCSLEVPVRF